MFQTSCTLLAMSKAIILDKMAALFLIGSQVKNKKLLLAPRMTGAENAKIRQESPTPRGTENAKG
jgi:hypothetical protein